VANLITLFIFRRCWNYVNPLFAVVALRTPAKNSNNFKKIFLSWNDQKSIRMYLDKYFRSWNGPFEFGIDKINAEAPSTFGVYQVLKKSGAGFDIMYIGIATGATIRQRLTSHCKGAGNKNIDTYGKSAELWFSFWPCDFISAKQIESHVISDEKPPFNVKNEYRFYIPNITLH
jgi:predicted GIY-YIG superfamily endonuclease